MYHNRPRNETWCSFSTDDVGVFLGDKVKYSKASDYKYEYEIFRTKETKDISFKEAFHEFSKEMNNPIILEKAFLNKINPDEDLSSFVLILS